MKYEIVLLPGDGIGPEIADSMTKVVDRLGLSITWAKMPCGETTIASENTAMPQACIEAIRKHKLAIKGPTGTPIGKGHQSANVTLRKSLDLFANVRPVQSIPGVETPFKNVDMLIVRENTEDLYASIEHQLAPGVFQSLKILTQPGCERIVRYAFEAARSLKRKKVTCVHKANIMKITDGMFLEVFREIAKSYSDIEATDLIVDNTCMQMVTKPEQFDVLVTLNLYGDIISDLGAGLIGGLGVAAGANIGLNSACFEAVHGTAPDIAGQNVCNPTAMILSAVMMLEHMKEFEAATRLRSALFAVLKEGRVRTRDLKGTASTTEFTGAIIERL